MHKLAALLLLPLVFAATFPAQAATVPGAIPGSFGVSETGAATYSIPIAVPPGTAGMEPKLSLNYSSQGGNGIAGVGWSLGGLSAIIRCPQTIVQDGQTRGVQIDSNDKLCLDGQRLIVINGATYGTVGAEYRTEIESFSKIVSLPFAGTPGAQYFLVKTKAGQIIEFGNTDDSRVEAQGKTIVAAWAANKISDTVGNYFTFTYFEDNDNGEHRITRIEYTGNAAAVALYNAVEFQYEARPDDSVGYLAGSLKQETQRLAHIQTKANGAFVMDYALNYEAGAITGRSRLAGLTQCAADGSCLAPTSFAWQEGEALNFAPSAVEQSLVTGTMAEIWFALGDVNGDGRIDATALKRNPLAFYTSLGGDSGFGTTAVLSLGGGSMSGTTDLGRFYMADYDGDGLSDPALCLSSLKIREAVLP